MGRKRKNAEGQRNRERLQQRWSKMHIQDEVAYIVGRAREHEARFVTLGSLVFFSTGTGDAWMLDPGDGFALCLAEGGLPQSVRIVETEESFAIEWDRQFRIDGDVFAATDGSGEVTSFIGYPTASILEAIRRAGQHQPPE